MKKSNVGIIVLAAGASTRMGEPKQLLLFQGRSLLRHTVDVAIASVCDPTIVVLGANSPRIRADLKNTSSALHAVENPAWSEGMGTSIKAGVEHLQKVASIADAAIIAVCDQPFISAQLIDHIVERYRASSKAIVACEYSQTLGVPALFDSRLFPDLTSLTVAGAKHLIERYSSEVERLSFSEGAIDIDTPVEYEQLIYNGSQSREV